MGSKYTFFMDDFGTRAICKGGTDARSPLNEIGFALGGVIVAEEDQAFLKDKVTTFCERWNIPELHGSKIRVGKGKFSFLKQKDEHSQKFMADLELLVLDSRLIAHACMICRPGYRDRYSATHADSDRWAMSKTAFDISVERAAKFAQINSRRLDIVFERTGAKEDGLIRGYYHSLKANGLSFNASNSGKYSPMSAMDFNKTLCGINDGDKKHPLLQLADLLLHPICHAVSGQTNRAYQTMIEHEMLLDQRSGSELIGIKYSCFDDEYGQHLHPINTQGTPKDPLRRSA